MNRLRLCAALAAAAFALAFAGCRGAPGEGTSRSVSGQSRSATAGVRRNLSPEVDLGGVAERLHGFTQSHDELRATGARHDVRLEGAALRYRSASGAMAFETLGLELGRPSVTADGLAVRIGDGVEERTINRAHGVERTWRFARRPNARGAFTMGLRASGLSFRSESAKGITFGAAGRGIRVSHGTWIDGRGTRTAIPIHRSGSELEFTVADRVLKESAFPAVLDPVIGDEEALDAELRAPTQTQGVQSGALGRGDTTYLVAFEGYGIGGPVTFATRVRRSDGVRLDVPFAIGSTAVNPYLPSLSVVFDGEAFVVMRGEGCDVELVRVREADGVIIGRRPVKCAGRWPSPLMFDGATHMVLTDGIVQRFDRELRVLSSVGPLGPSGPYGHRASFGAGQLLVTWQDSPDGVTLISYAQRFSAANYAPIDPAPSALGPGFFGARLFDGARFLLLRSLQNSVGVGPFEVHRINASDGARLPPIQVPGDSYVGTTSSQFIAVEGNVATRYDGATGTALNPVTIPTTSPLALGVGGPEHVILAREGLIRIDPATGALTTTLNVLERPISQRPPSLAFSSTSGMAVFSDDRWALLATPLDLAGRPTAPARVVQPGPSNQWHVTFDGAHFVVLNGLLAQRFASDGTPVDAVPVPVESGGSYGPARVLAASADGATLVLYNEAHIFRDGQVFGVGPTAGPPWKRANSVVVDGKDFIVSLNDTQGCRDVAVRVQADGQVSAPVPLGAGACYPLEQSSFVNGDAWLFAQPIYGADAVDVRRHQLPDYGPLLPGTLRQFGYPVALGHDGTSLAVLGTRESPGAAMGEFAVHRMRLADMSAVEPSADAGVDAATELPRLDWSRYDRAATLVGVDEGKFVFGYSRFVPELGSERAFTRVMTYAVDGIACSVDDDCASTRCIAGTCGRLLSPADGGVDASADGGTQDAATDGAADVDAAAAPLPDAMADATPQGVATAPDAPSAGALQDDLPESTASCGGCATANGPPVGEALALGAGALAMVLRRRRSGRRAAGRA